MDWYHTRNTGSGPMYYRAHDGRSNVGYDGFGMMDAVREAHRIWQCMDRGTYLVVIEEYEDEHIRDEAMRRGMCLSDVTTHTSITIR